MSGAVSPYSLTRQPAGPNPGKLFQKRREVVRGSPLYGARAARSRSAQWRFQVLKKAFAVVTIAGAIAGIAATPALAAGQICLTTNVVVNGTPSPANGTNCVDTP